jgi:hypothetical protein
VCGERKRALELAREAGVDDVSVRLARAEHDGDLAGWTR